VKAPWPARERACLCTSLRFSKVSNKIGAGSVNPAPWIQRNHPVL
jgi:hypothetical protein